jgi:hypothetical protein
MRPEPPGEVRIAERDDGLGDPADDRGYRQAVQVFSRYGSDGAKVGRRPQIKQMAQMRSDLSCPFSENTRAYRRYNMKGP